jgi:drug/metabolite transporter (DMT)-like permease
MFFAALGVVPIAGPALAGADLARVPGSTWWLVGYIVLFPTIATYFLNLWALKRVSSNTVATFIYLQPLFAALSSPWVLGESIGGRTVAAGLAIFLGLGLVILSERSAGEAVPMQAVQEE